MKFNMSNGNRNESVPTKSHGHIIMFCDGPSPFLKECSLSSFNSNCEIQIITMINYQSLTIYD